MTTFVLVHGAWGGSYSFRLVRRRLQESGHDVFTPSLTGIGERAHLTGPHVNLTTHVNDVANTILYQDLHDIVLLGFSYGGAVVSGALEHIADRVGHLVFLDAFVPNDGDSISLMGGHPSDMVGPGAEWAVAPLAREFEDPDEGAFNLARRVSHPRGCFLEQVRLAQPLEDFGFPLTYIKATGEPRPAEGHPFWDAHDRAVDSPAWTSHEITTNHMIPSNRPQELTDILNGLATG